MLHFYCDSQQLNKIQNKGTHMNTLNVRRIYNISKYLLIAIVLLHLTSCATPYSGLSTTSYRIDISITTDPPDVNIMSLTSKSKYTHNQENTDFSFEKFGPGKHWVGATPYRGYINVTAQSMPDGTIQTTWDSSANYAGGDTIMLLKTMQTRKPGAFYNTHHHTMTLEFMLELEGYETELVTEIVADGTYSYIDLLKQASAKPITIHRVLRRK